MLRLCAGIKILAVLARVDRAINPILKACAQSKPNAAALPELSNFGTRVTEARVRGHVRERLLRIKRWIRGIAAIATSSNQPRRKYRTLTGAPDSPPLTRLSSRHSPICDSATSSPPEQPASPPGSATPRSPRCPDTGPPPNDRGVRRSSTASHRGCW